MLTPIEHAQIQALITKAHVSLEDEKKTLKPNEFNLNKQAILIELAEEIDFISTLLYDENAHDTFRIHAKERAQRNAGSNLTLFSEIKTCNALYWQMACILFPEQTPLSILEPGIMCLVEVDMQVSRPSLFSPHETVAFKKSSIPFIPFENLQHYLAVGEHLFDVQDIECFNFDWHLAFYNAINQQYPQLSEAIYQHNHALIALKAQIQLVTGENQTPLNAIGALITELRLGGETLTGQVDTTLRASIALNHFLRYLELLPAQTLSACLQLQGTSKKRTLGMILHDFKHNHDKSCVETAAIELKELCTNAANHSVLTSPVQVTIEQLKSIKQQYKKGHYLETKGDQSMNILRIPASLLKKAFSTIRLEGDGASEDLLTTLLAIPCDLYSSFFERLYPSLTPKMWINLANAINQALFGEQQISAIFNALLLIKEQLGGPEALLAFATKANNSAFFIHVLTSNATSEQEQMALLSKRVEGFTPLTYIINPTVEFFRDIFQHLRPEHHHLLLQNVDEKENTLLYFLMPEDPDIACAILELLAPEHRLLIAQKTNLDGESTLFLSTVHIKTFQAFWTLFNETQQQSLLLEKTKDGTTLLYESVTHTNALVFETLLSCYKDRTARIAAINATINDGSTTLHAATKNIDTLKMVLEQYPNQGARIDALSITDHEGHTPLYWACEYENTETIEMILGLYPDDDARFNVLHQPNKDMLKEFSNSPDVIETIWPYYPKATILALFNLEDREGDKLLHWATKNAVESLRTILQLTHDDSDMQYQCLNFLNAAGHTVLQALVINNPTHLEKAFKNLSNTTLKRMMSQRDEHALFSWVALHHPEKLQHLLTALSDIKMQVLACQQILQISPNISRTNPVISSAFNYVSSRVQTHAYRLHITKRNPATRAPAATATDEPAAKYQRSDSSP